MAEVKVLTSNPERSIAVGDAVWIMFTDEEDCVYPACVASVAIDPNDQECAHVVVQAGSRQFVCPMAATSVRG